jgi:peptide/nickel transport system permease protein
MGPIVILLAAVGIAIGITYLSVGLENRTAVRSALFCAAAGSIIYFPAQILLDSNRPRVGLLLMFVALIGVALVGSVIFSRIDRGPIIRTNIISVVIIGLLIVVDKLMQSWRPYIESDDINFRPISTFGQSTAWLFEVPFWVRSLDIVLHMNCADFNFICWIY